MALPLLITPASAQSRNDNWFLDPSNWISFAFGSPTNVNGSPFNAASGASMSEPSGQLSMYTNGQVLLNADHLILTGSSGLLQGSANAQPHLILPMPGDPDRYAVFSSDASPDPRCGWLTVNMTLDAGLGAVEGAEMEWFMKYPNYASGKLSAAPHANGSDYWVLLHEQWTNAFFAYQLTPQGLDSIPVISYAGVSHDPAHYDGQIVVSYAGDLSATTACYNAEPFPGDSNYLQLFHFDNSLGEMEFLFDIPGFRKPFGVEFSPDGSKLYVTDEYSTPGSIHLLLWQFDLADLDPSAVLSSKEIVWHDSTLFSFSNSYKILALAPDGKIYYRHRSDTSYLGVVNDPNQTAAACAFVENGFLCSNDSIRGLPNLCKRYHDSEAPWTLITSPRPADGGLRIIPNPMTETAMLMTRNDRHPEKLNWFDTSGRLVHIATIDGMNESVLIDRGSLRSGPYFIEVLDARGVIGLVKIMIR